MPRIRLHRRGERRRQVTQEPALIDAALLGRPLSSFRRRLAAYLLDLMLAGIVLLGLFLGLSLLGLHRADPELIPAFRQSQRMAPGPAKERARREAAFRLFQILGKRNAELLDDEARAALERGELDNFWELFGDEDTNFRLTLGSETRIAHSEGRRQIVLGSDLFLGRFSSVFTWGAGFVGWFTLITWWGRGRTPGKWLLRLRVARLDGKRLRLWDSFGRAGGYGASAATLSLGFLEAAWHPNRQALHDRIANTVVLRDPPPNQRRGHGARNSGPA